MYWMVNFLIITLIDKKLLRKINLHFISISDHSRQWKEKS